MRLAVQAQAALLLLLAAAPAADGKTCSRFITAQMRANARENVKKYAWARDEQQRAVSQADPWMKLSDDELWSLVSSQELPRDIHRRKVLSCVRANLPREHHGQVSSL